MSYLIQITQHCYAFEGAKLVARCFRTVSPHSKIHVRRKNTVHVLLRGKGKESENLIAFAFAVKKQIAERKKHVTGETL